MRHVDLEQIESSVERKMRRRDMKSSRTTSMSSRVISRGMGDRSAK